MLTIIKIVKIIANPIKSLIRKYGWNGILSLLVFNPIGLLEPVVCKKNKWIITNIEIIKGNIKWSLKNRDKVALLTENPPQIHLTIKIPM